MGGQGGKPKFPPRPVLPPGSPALDLQHVVRNAQQKLANLASAIAVGDQEARMALLLIAYQAIVLEAQAAVDEIVATGMTAKAAAAILNDRDQRRVLEAREGSDWRGKTANAERLLDERGAE